MYAERKAGELLKETVKSGNPTGTNQYEEKSNDTTIPKLKDIGITRDQSSNWQRIANIPEENPLHDDRGLDNPTGTNQYEEKLPDVTKAPKLSEIGISKRDSSNWQLIKK